ncbi:hypothetical protein CIPAW_02G073500 [Carya illinoinensis]|uniref:WRKY domain-containing protein n=1 Tax=Carya illinoinensis TaxID=32201 RepID=A0A8T1RBD8_CARIL|nr:hypothetical protein CIPAW_02G073500 [Carya illinoinensis]
MEKKQELKTDNSMANSAFSDEIPGSLSLPSIFDMPCDQSDHQKGLSLGFMDMLSIPADYNPSLFDLFSTPTMMPQPQVQPQQQQQQQPLPSPASTVPESSEVVNTPATPNSSSISSSSNEGQTKAGGGEEDQDQEKTKKQSYYRCTTAGCGVKKRVERSCDDSSIVVTTYEGQHKHPCPVTPRGSIGIATEAAGFSTFASPFVVPHPQYQQQQHPYIYSLQPRLNVSTSTTNLNHAFPSFVQDQRRFGTSSATFLRDHGLLQDIVPSQTRKDQFKEEE